MNDLPSQDQSRESAHRALQQHFERHSSPRFILSIIVALTGGTGFVASWAMLHLGETQMVIRYPVAVLLAYAVFLGLLRVWAEYERGRANLHVENLKPLPQAKPRPIGLLVPNPKGSWGDIFSVFDLLNFGETGEGCALIFVAAVILCAVAAFLSTAPALISDVFLDAVLMTALYKRLNRAARQHWLSTAIQRTWSAALGVAIALALTGLIIESIYPKAKSIGDIWRTAATQQQK